MRVVSPVTKASEQTFAFVSEAYDGSKASCTTKTHDTLIEWNYNKSGESDFAPASELDPIVINAYNEFGRGLGQQKQRDYIYYGMTNENTNRGVINENIKELVYRFKISPAKINILDYQSSNDQANSDPSFLSTSSVFKGKKNKLNPEDNSIQSYLWSQGSLEINFYFYLGSAGSTALTVYKQPISISPGELWEVKKSIEQRETCGLTFHYHYISSTNDLVAKWYYPNNMVIDSFDLQDKTTQIWFSIYEEDPSGTYSRTFSEYCKYTNNFSLNVQTGKNEKRSFGVNYSDTDERNRTCSAEETINIGSDHLGDAYLEYIYNIIKEETYDENGVHGYNLASVQTAGGQVSVTFVPFNINNL